MSEDNSSGSSYELQDGSDSSDADTSSTGEITEQEISSSSDEDVPLLSERLRAMQQVSSPLQLSSEQESASGHRDAADSETLSYSQVLPSLLPFCTARGSSLIREACHDVENAPR